MKKKCMAKSTKPATTKKPITTSMFKANLWQAELILLFSIVRDKEFDEVPIFIKDLYYE